MSDQPTATDENILDEAFADLDDSTSTSDEANTGSLDTDIDNVDEQKEEEVAELDSSLFEDVEEEAQPKPVVSEAQKVFDKKQVYEATINKGLADVVGDGGAIDNDKFNALPEWVQNGINNKLNSVQSPQKNLTETDLNRVLEQRDDNDRYKAILSKLKATKPQQAILAQEFKQLTSLGMLKSKALEKAIILSGIDGQKAIDEGYKTGYSRGLTKIPNADQPGHVVNVSDKKVEDMTDDELFSMLHDENKPYHG